MAKVYCFVARKGGVYKTTATINTAGALAKKRKKVLLIDLDPQGNLSDNVKANRERISIMEVMAKENTIEEAIQHLEKTDIVVSPPNSFLASKEFNEILEHGDAEQSLKKAIENVKNEYDYILIDTPPSLGELTINALVAADEAIIPTSTNANAIDGLMDLIATIKEIQKSSNPELKIKGILIARYQSRLIVSQELKSVLEEISENEKIRVFRSTIRNSVDVETATALRLDIFDYKPSSKVAEDYHKFVSELMRSEDVENG